MATPRTSTNKLPNPLVDELARVLPKDVKFTAHHLSTPPTLTEPLCHPPAYPPNESQDASERRARKGLKTYCEKHFLAISIETPDAKEQVEVLALEIYIYTTAYSTIIFVSKADSTGYLDLLKLPQGTPSPTREIATTFVCFLVKHRRRKDTQCVVNLFARAQSQYLFPGSVKYSGKHVLDDRGLVRWWCRVLNPLLEDQDKWKNKWEHLHGYLVIPGLDNYEMRAFLPRSNTTAANWTIGHPLDRISQYTADPATYGQRIPIRCLIPQYPDDPKARFVDELDDCTPERARLFNGWGSPQTLEQFWEMMAFRQECSSGRMTGFIWLVFDPPSSNKKRRRDSRSAAAFIQTPNAFFSGPTETGDRPGRYATPEPSQELTGPITTPSTTTSKSTQSTPVKSKPKRSKKKKVLTGRIIPREPKFKTHQRAQFPKLTETLHYSWPEEGRGLVILDESGYKRAVELLLHLEFGTLEQAIASTARWVNDVNMGQDWGLQVIGQLDSPAPQNAVSGNGTATNDLSGMVKRKRPVEAAPEALAASLSEYSAPVVNNLCASLIRKKVKTTLVDTTTTPPSSLKNEAPKVNNLGAGLIRKKPKAI